MKRSLFIVDCKLEIMPVVAPAYKALGIEVRFANPTGAHAEMCPHTNFNVYESVIDAYWATDPKANANSTTYLRSIIRTTNPPPPAGSQNEFFINGGRDAGFAFTGGLVVLSPEIASPTEVYRLASDIGAARDFLQRAGELVGKKNDPFAQEVGRAARSVMEVASGKNEHHFGDFIKHVRDPLLAFDGVGALRDHGHYAAARISDLRKRPMVIAVMFAFKHLIDYSIYTSLMTQAVLAACKAVPDGVPVECLLDEFPTLKLGDIERETVTLRGLKCCAQYYVQARSDLAAQYSEKAAATIYSQSDIKQFLAFDDLDDAKHVSELLGSAQAKEFDARMEARFEKVDFGLRDASAPLISPQELLALPRDEQIIKIRSMRPIRAKKIPYWEIAGLRELLGDNPLEGKAPRARAKVRLHLSQKGARVAGRRIGGIRSAKEPRIASPAPLRASSFLWLAAVLGLIGFAGTHELPSYLYWLKP